MTSQEIKELLLYGESIHLECKECSVDIPKSVWETYSSFANTYGGTILLGVHEDTKEPDVKKRFTIVGVSDTARVIGNFWNTINGDKTNVNILKDENVYSVNVDGKEIVVIDIPQADYRQRPVYINGNPLKGTFKRTYEGDYHCIEAEVRAMLRDANEQGCDGMLIEDYTMGDVDLASLHAYRNEFAIRNQVHTFNQLDDKEFLKSLGGYTVNRKQRQEGLTLAGLLMFGKGLSIRERLDNIRMDYIDKTNLADGQRWSDRITYDGTWENNLYNFFHKVVGKLTADLRKPFVLNGIARNDDSPVFRAVREAVTNMIIHADYMITGVLRIEKRENLFYFSNPGSLRLPVERIYEGNHTAARNPRLQDMFRMIGYGDNIGSGFPTILDACRQELWRKPDLKEFSDLRTVDLKIWMVSLMPPEITSKMKSLYGNAYKHMSGMEKQVMATALLEEEVSNSDMQTLLEKNPIEVGTILNQLVEKQLLIPYGKGRWTMYQPNRHFLEGTAQDTAQDTAQVDTTYNTVYQKDTINPIQDTAQVTAQVTAQETTQVTTQVTTQEKSIRIQHQEKLIIGYCKEPRTLKDIAAYLNYKNTRWLRETYITPLLGKKLWMTSPDKPRSSNQRYTSIPPKE
ncbi:MAG: putative DNA binding domain-containing protein [Bacteroidales bacterium]|nr:putative DNA binding domain-containing protein [Bacteroidales bacterium]